eukprot:6770559-Alexandrium_andersonii.AAC.1
MCIRDRRNTVRNWTQQIHRGPDLLDTESSGHCPRKAGPGSHLVLLDWAKSIRQFGPEEDG